MHPHGYLEKAAQVCRERGVWLVLDEVMTGFGRTGAMFAFQREGVTPDLIALAKGLTGGYLPLAATLACSGNLRGVPRRLRGVEDLFPRPQLQPATRLVAPPRWPTSRFSRRRKRSSATRRWSKSSPPAPPNSGTTPTSAMSASKGLICAIEIVRDFTTRESFPFTDRIGHRICEAARAHGLLTRPIGDVLVLMTPYCTTESQLAEIGRRALARAERSAQLTRQRVDPAAEAAFSFPESLWERTCLRDSVACLPAADSPQSPSAVVSANSVAVADTTERATELRGQGTFPERLWERDKAIFADVSSCPSTQLTSIPFKANCYSYA